MFKRLRVELDNIKYRSKTIVHKIKVKASVFIVDFDYKFGLLLLFLISFLLLFFGRIQIPNILGISDIQIASHLLSVIIGTLASILGIVIAILLVAFEILRKSYNVYAFKTFFRDEKLKELITLYLSTIIISLFTITSLSDPLKPNAINLIYFSLSLFLVSLAILFPYSRAIISSTQSKEKIKEIANKINHSTINAFDYSVRCLSSTAFDYVRQGKENPIYFYSSQIEENPIFVLSEVGIRTLKEGDRMTPKLILVESENKLLEMLNNTTSGIDWEQRNVINTVFIVIRNISRQAIELKQESTLLTVLNTIENVHNFCAENKIPWHVVIELNEFIESLLEETLVSGIDDTTKRGLYMIERIMKNHLLKNIPQEDEIKFLYSPRSRNREIKHDPEKDLQWLHVSEEYMRIIYHITEKAINFKKSEIVTRGLFALGSIGSEVVNMPLGDLQKLNIIGWCGHFMEDLVIKSAEEGLYKRALTLSCFGSTYIERALEQKREFSKEPLIRFAETLINLSKKGILDTFSLNQLGTVGRGCASKVDENHIYKEALIFIVNVFNRLREEIEGQIIDTNKRVYLELYNQTTSLKKWMEQHNKRDKEVENAVDSALSRFILYETIKNELEKGIVKWPSMEKDK